MSTLAYRKLFSDGVKTAIFPDQTRLLKLPPRAYQSLMGTAATQGRAGERIILLERSYWPMPKKGKFSSASPELMQQPAKRPSARQPIPAIVPEPVRGRGRPPGKRSDPDYQPTTVLLRQQTKKIANRLLEDGNTGLDLSELIEQLLTEWIQKQL